MKRLFHLPKPVTSSVLILSLILLSGSAEDIYQHDLPVQSPLIQDLRQRVGGLAINPLWVTDMNLARMIIDTGYRVDRAAERLRQTADFRARVKADQLLDWVPSRHFTLNLPYEITGKAFDGSPVVLLPIGSWNVRGFFSHSRSADLYSYYLRILEDARSRLDGYVNPETKAPVDQAIFIVDAQGYNLHKLLSIRATWTLLRFIYAIDRHYPFLVQKWYIVNAPIHFHIFWRLTRHAATPILKTTVEIYSQFNRDRGLNALALKIPKEAIPVYLGGKYILDKDRPGDSKLGPAPDPYPIDGPIPVNIPDVYLDYGYPGISSFFEYIGSGTENLLSAAAKSIPITSFGTPEEPKTAGSNQTIVSTVARRSTNETGGIFKLFGNLLQGKFPK